MRAIRELYLDEVGDRSTEQMDRDRRTATRIISAAAGQQLQADDVQELAEASGRSTDSVRHQLEMQREEAEHHGIGHHVRPIERLEHFDASTEVEFLEMTSNGQWHRGRALRDDRGEIHVMRGDQAVASIDPDEHMSIDDTDTHLAGAEPMAMPRFAFRKADSR